MDHLTTTRSEASSKRCRCRGGLSGETAAKLKEHYERYDRMSEREKNEVVRFFRVQKMYDETRKRLIYSAGQDGLELRKEVLEALAATGWDIRTGNVSATFMDRELQKWLEALMA